MHAQVRKTALNQEFQTPERCYILEVSNDNNDECVSIARARVEPGVTTALHYLQGVAERYVITAGAGRMEVGGMDPQEVAAGDVVIIPPDTSQRITNIGNEDLIFYCICTPPFKPDCYKSLE
jgi:mannose-6-phosphate isomerase-like protein (cupin superfamily)